VSRADIDPGWFVYGREGTSSAGVIKRIAWPTGPLRKWPKISRLVQPGFRTKGEAERVAEQLRAMSAPKRNPVKPDNWAAPAFMVTHFPVNQAYALTWGDQIISVNVGAGAYQKLFSSRAELIDALRVRGLSVNKGGKVSGAVKVGSA